jgi:hypothetical protein
MGLGFEAIAAILMTEEMEAIVRRSFHRIISELEFRFSIINNKVIALIMP